MDTRRNCAWCFGSLNPFESHCLSFSCNALKRYDFQSKIAMTNRLESAIKVFDYSQMWKARVGSIYTGNVGMPKQRQVVHISLRAQTSVSKVVYISTKPTPIRCCLQTLFSASKLRFQGVTYSTAPEKVMVLDIITNASVNTTYLHTLKNGRPCYRRRTRVPPVLRTESVSKLLFENVSEMDRFMWPYISTNEGRLFL